jgi:acetylornithine deacetylase/succinyl-diaminopimelate desuccinylase-like protein
MKIARTGLARALVALLLMLPARGTAQAPIPSEQDVALARDIFHELIEINTTASSGNTTEAAEAMAARLRAAGFTEDDLFIAGPQPRKGNLVARLRGSGQGGNAILLLAHLDVVEAQREDWSRDPFEFIEEDGYFYGRGTQDDKAQAAIWIATLIRMKRERFAPDRDIIVALTADEEGGTDNGVVWLLENHRDRINAAFALNEGGWGEIRAGRNAVNQLQASEKVYQSFQLTVRNPGGHSSLPRPDNAINALARGIARIADFHFPVQLNEVSRAYFEKNAQVESGQAAADMRALAAAQNADPAVIQRLAASPLYNSMMRTTCVATRLDAGHADNALPQRATALVNCRMLPGSDPEEVRSTLARIASDTSIHIEPIGQAIPSPPSPLDPAIVRPIERITTEMWPGAVVVPTMLTGATDGLFLRNAGIPTYGISGLFYDDVRAHGRDERIGVRAFHEGQEFLYRLVKALTSGSTARAQAGTLGRGEGG